ncbi:ribbon-helix-helix domain-containing protein [Bradyrhizobium sp. BEA-2-5]|uniref:ribbon-helix-helix domain-containing protein n=1 Tax=Bradyrhizobium sp. BEA-2-5 TaxID=3080015 RepID=UPI00293E04FA|nr:ribbon-helix-helix domain-containing protein [Bradyrhizobium sp. BEA-2-5]WOH82125.1 ribbon-helix-helix domain-containing protein [Bradyrhizobium sp. BEA-2-5]
MKTQYHASLSERLSSPIVKRSITMARRETCVTLEEAFWKGFKEIASKRNMRPGDLAAIIKKEGQCSNLSSAIRLFVLDYYRGLCHDCQNPSTEPLSR